MTDQGICDLLHIQAAFESIASAVGKQKETILRCYADDKLVCKALWYLLSPYTAFGLTAVKLNKPVPNAAQLRLYLPDLFSLLHTLNNVPAVDNSLLGAVQQELTDIQNKAGQEAATFAAQFIAKSLRLGVTAKTVNKIFGKKYIPIMECMLANKYFEHPNAVEGQEFYLTQKLDGIRCLAFVEMKHGEPNKISFYSRQGQRIDGLEEIEQELLLLAANHGVPNFVFDGELLVDDAYIHLCTPDVAPSADNYKRTIQTVRKDGIKRGVTFNVFDALPMFDFTEAGCCLVPYAERRKSLGHLFENTAYFFSHLRLLPVLYSGSDPEQIRSWLSTMRELHQEGVMVNLANAPYECKRTSNLLKVKAMQDCDLRIIGFVPGKGHFSDTLGALEVDYKGSPLRVGSGFTDDMRAWLWENQADLLGRIVTVQYFEETQDKSGIKSLRFPVFKELREPGKEESYH